VRQFIIAMIIALYSPTLIASTITNGMPEIKRRAMALELYLQDKDDYKNHCPHLGWEQPKIDVYRKTLKSQLPATCKS